VSPARVEVIYYGSDPVRFSYVDDRTRSAARERLGYTDTRPLVGFVGALGDDRKGFETLFAAWRRLVATPAWHADLVVVGAGAALPSWRERVAQCGLDGRIRFLGFREDVPDVLAALDALVHPARYEAYGLSVHEAICRGVPAIVSACAGVAEQYPAALRGLLITDPTSSDELEQRLRAWHDRRHEYRQETRTLSDTLRAYTWDNMAERIVRVVEQAA
jgi:glycosyltransferase involved in cell wall biosynthesis